MCDSGNSWYCFRMKPRESLLAPGRVYNSPDAVQEVWQNLPPGSVELIGINDEARFLANEYIAAKVLGEASIGDALHVAVATVAGADLILSWNFKHIVNFSRIRGFNSVNIRMGYRAMTILSPKEAGDEEESI